MFVNFKEREEREAGRKRKKENDFYYAENKCFFRTITDESYLNKMIPSIEEGILFSAPIILYVDPEVACMYVCMYFMHIFRYHTACHPEVARMNVCVLCVYIIILTYRWHSKKINIMYACVYVYMYTSMHHTEVKERMMHLYHVCMYICVSCV
jgi:hypothetical protein